MGNYKEIIDSARKVIEIEAEAVSALGTRLDESFAKAVEMVLACQGRVVVTGMGKSGLICQKMAATMASTGTPAIFLHPAEGVHGDLGILMKGDVVIAVSNSGESIDLLRKGRNANAAVVSFPNRRRVPARRPR